MQDSRVSLTALLTAYIRAYHATHDNPRIFDDFLAPQLFGEQEAAFFDKNLALSLAYFDPELAAQSPDEASALAAVMRVQSAPISLPRSRYTEEFLMQSIAQGVEQYVILGAGLDTFAFRKPELMKRLHVFEIDHPATQAEKQRRVAAAGWPVPASLHWVPVDFSKQQIATALADSPYDRNKLTLFSWLGVTYYLKLERVIETLRAIAQIARPGSSIIFDYLEADAFVPERAGRIVKRMMEIVRNAGEPMSAGFDPATLLAELAGLGWELEEDLDPAMIEARYFAGRTDGYHAFEQVHFARAQVR